MSGRASDGAHFRHVLGHYPTGVCAVTVLDGRRPLGMAVGSFTSVSLDPPLVAFLADRTSTTLPAVIAAERFCINVLGDHQEAVCRSLAVKGGDKFAELPWRISDSGRVRIDESIAWLDCVIDQVVDAGDHRIVIAMVEDLDVGSLRPPLVFYRGGYAKFASA